MHNACACWKGEVDAVSALLAVSLTDQSLELGKSCAQLCVKGGEGRRSGGRDWNARCTPSDRVLCSWALPPSSLSRPNVSQTLNASHISRVPNHRSPQGPTPMRSSSAWASLGKQNKVSERVCGGREGTGDGASGAG
jgi:hypothetical protein